MSYRLVGSTWLFAAVLAVTPESASCACDIGERADDSTCALPLARDAALLQRAALSSRSGLHTDIEGSAPWWQEWGADARAAAEALVEDMTWEEKLRLVTGHGEGWDAYTLRSGFYTGITLDVPRLNIPAILAQDAAQGFRTSDPKVVGTVTSWPSGLAMAAAWDTALTHRYASAIGTEFRGKGANAILGPSLDIVRVMKAGRNVESLSGEDPLLGAANAREYVSAMKGQGIACVGKHFILNGQETNRYSYNSIASERTKWEVHYPPFVAGIEAGLASVMCAYNSVDGSQACENSDLIQGDLKGRMGFQGWVMSDWWAIHSRPNAARSGLDQIMPGTQNVWDSNDLKNSAGEARVDDMARRVLFGRISTGAFDRPSCIAALGWKCPSLLYANVTSCEHTALAREVAAASAVLLKNDGVLPLKKGVRVALLGSACNFRQETDPDAIPWNRGDYYVVGGSGRVLSPNAISVRQALEARGFHVLGSYTDSVEEALAQLRDGGADVDVAIACGGVWSGEAADRPTLRLDQHDFLVGLAARNAAETKLPLVVLTMSSGSILTDFAKDSAAVVSLFLAGQATGNAFADVLFGKVNPSGRLPVTFPKQDSDGQAVCQGLECPASEGIFVGWHALIGKPVAYPFGHGLSYTQFSYEWVQEPQFHESRGGEITMKLRIQNLGLVAGAEVAQLYLQFPASAGEPERVLRGFKKTLVLPPGGNEIVSFYLSSRDVSIWWDCEVAKKHLEANVHCDVKACDGTSCYSCGERLEYLMKQKAPQDATAQLHTEFPEECGLCESAAADIEAAAGVALPKSQASYQGCFADSRFDRDLPVLKGNLDYQQCEAACAGFSFFGRQWKGECHCGDTYGKHGTASGCDCRAANIGGDNNCVYKAAPVAASTPAPIALGQRCTDGWRRINGAFGVALGASSRDERLVGHFEVPVAEKAVLLHKQ
mmetsp:Transcript_103210/g.296199  ORF Transcript_103210/g.296199 Transcript_103210/m.296199 type:complete len:943 (-) Transcript_103210:332-3160(-)|eukprot:CAMPEP_0177350216 /NCGR_PEP_ID=MMETSP0368-20130122/31209_1 /TAXON_ID=447022 ORGANISM="Scrippsiella hangoei-like, Strain SHHI-4" /NCGR_SAMPLE_ID=MMETSP0368 /ASSEMBLY_ACC=CAM_ASM_000363 /LENGTH=942 /DNA_ID=CAMNT_0018812137 /DNA_START=12 /DNA_END=2840 /DNA_ORIENTATION=-